MAGLDEFKQNHRMRVVARLLDEIDHFLGVVDQAASAREQKCRQLQPDHVSGVGKAVGDEELSDP